MVDSIEAFTLTPFCRYWLTRPGDAPSPPGRYITHKSVSPLIVRFTDAKPHLATMLSFPRKRESIRHKLTHGDFGAIALGHVGTEDFAQSALKTNSRVGNLRLLSPDLY